MKKLLAAVALLAIGATSARAQIAAEIVKGELAYQNSQAEAAKNIFAGIIASRQQVTNEQRVIAFKYLGAYWALQSVPGAADSANSFFKAALDYDPFTDLDRKVFAPDEQAAFARAKRAFFKIGVEPIHSQTIDVNSTNPDSSTYTFRVVSTHAAKITAEIRKVGEPNIREPIANFSNTEGIRELPWNGLINLQRADTGIYEFSVVANDNIITTNPAATEVQRFRVEWVHAPFEDTIPDFRDVNLGGTDTLKSRYSRSLPFKDAANGVFVGALAAALPFIAFNADRGNMTQWSSHATLGVAMGALAGFGAATYATSHRDDPRAVAENARRRNLRARFNAGVIARNNERRAKTILVIRPLTSAGTGN